MSNASVAEHARGAEDDEEQAEHEADQVEHEAVRGDDAAKGRTPGEKQGAADEGDPRQPAWRDSALDEEEPGCDQEDAPEGVADAVERERKQVQRVREAVVVVRGVRRELLFEQTVASDVLTACRAICSTAPISTKEWRARGRWVTPRRRSCSLAR